MYLIKETEDKKKMVERPPFGPGFSQDRADQAVKMQVWGTSFSDPGPDYCKFKLLDEDDRVIDTQRVDGY